MLQRMSQDLTLRIAQSADVGALDRLFQRSYARLLMPDYPPSVMVTAIPVIARAQPALVGSGLFYVVEDADGIVGAGGWSLQPPGGMQGQRGTGHVRHVATDPDAVRRGVGRMLMEHIALVAKASGMMELACHSTLTAVPFYESMGFEQLGGISIPLAGGIIFPAVRMRRLL
jgi:GNAT superfamily N-acetyltransferase